MTGNEDGMKLIQAGTRYRLIFTTLMNPKIYMCKQLTGYREIYRVTKNTVDGDTQEIT